MMHRRRFTRAGVQCGCGFPAWTVRHIVAYEVSSLTERLRYWLTYGRR